LISQFNCRCPTVSFPGYSTQHADWSLSINSIMWLPWVQQILTTKPSKSNFLTPMESSNNLTLAHSSTSLLIDYSVFQPPHAVTKHNPTSGYSHLFFF
jgi:hypothetical protein